MHAAWLGPSTLFCKNYTKLGILSLGHSGSDKMLSGDGLGTGRGAHQPLRFS